MSLEGCECILQLVLTSANPIALALVRTMECVLEEWISYVTAMRHKRKSTCWQTENKKYRCWRRTDGGRSWFQRFLSSVDNSPDPLAYRAEGWTEHLARYTGVRHLQLSRLAPDVVQWLGALDVTAALGDLGVSDRVDRDNHDDAQQYADHHLAYYPEHDCSRRSYDFSKHTQNMARLRQRNSLHTMLGWYCCKVRRVVRTFGCHCSSSWLNWCTIVRRRMGRDPGLISGNMFSHFNVRFGACCGAFSINQSYICPQYKQ